MGDLIQKPGLFIGVPCMNPNILGVVSLALSRERGNGSP